MRTPRGNGPFDAEVAEVQRLTLSRASLSHSMCHAGIALSSEYNAWSGQAVWRSGRGRLWRFTCLHKKAMPKLLSTGVCWRPRFNLRALFLSFSRKPPEYRAFMVGLFRLVCNGRISQQLHSEDCTRIGYISRLFLAHLQQGTLGAKFHISIMFWAAHFLTASINVICIFITREKDHLTSCPSIG